MTDSGESAKTALRRALTSPPVGPLDALHLAKRSFLQGERLSMSELASELGVNRSTLHRWVGSRTQLLGEVAVQLIERTLRRAYDQQTSRHSASDPTEVLVATVVQVVTDVRATGAMTPLFDTEGLPALQWLVADNGSFRPQLRALCTGLVADLWPDTPRPEIETSTETLTRLIESHLWLDALGNGVHTEQLAASIRLVVPRPNRAPPSQPKTKE